MPTAAIRYGTAYYPDHWPEADWERDLRQIRSSGLSLVRFGEFSWSWFEPREGVFDFAAYDRFMDLAAQVGLAVILCTPTCNPPPWLFAKHPDARQLDQRGRPHVGHRHQACYNHAAARALAERAVTTLARRYRDHPALAGWQIDNELTAGESASPRQVYDYHPDTITCYRRYLRERYKTLDNLNDAWVTNFWSSRYSDWEEIDPPRIGEIRSVNPGMWLEWSRFRDVNVAALGQWQIDWLRAVCPDFVIGTNIPELDPRSAVWLGQDYWALCRRMDFIGADLYVYCGDTDTEQRLLAYSCDVIRSAAHAAGARFGILETQAGPHTLPWRIAFMGGVWPPEFLHRSVELYAAHGAEQICFFLWRAARGGAEFGMNGLARIDGASSERTEALPAIMAAGEAARWRRARLPRAVVHYPQNSLRLAALYDPDATAVTALHGWHALLCDLGYQVEFIDDEGLTRGAQGEGVLALPYSLVLSDEQSQALAEAALAGRSLIAGFGTGFFDGWGRLALHAPGGGLAEALGVRLLAFDAERSLCLDGLPTMPEAIIQARAELCGGVAIDRRADGCPLVVERGSARWAGFDLGTLYWRTSLSERDRVVAWARERLRV